MKNLIYERPYRVNTYEADASGRLGIPGLFNYLQDIAAHHATALDRGKESLEKDNRFWVLSRILVDISDMPGWEEELIIRTWPRGVDKLFALRDFEIFGPKGIRYGAATSCWLMVNRDNRRPVRPDESLADLDGAPENESALVRYPSKLPGAGSQAKESTAFPVKYSDLDFNMHVNNVQYIRWIIDAYPQDFILGNTFRSAEVNYLAEALPGDKITVRSSEQEEKIFDHSIIRKNDSKELCRLKLSWK